MKNRPPIYFVALFSALFLVNFLFARFSPNTLKDNFWISAAIIAALDGLVILTLNWFFKH